MTASMKPKDLGEEYQVHRQGTTASDIIERTRREIMAEEAENAKAETAPAAPAPTARALRIGVADKPGTGPEYEDVPASLTSKAASVAKDIGGGMVEAPRQMLSGVSDAVREGAEAFNSLGNWLEEKIGGRVSVPLTGIKELDELIENPLEAIAGGKDRKKPAAPETVTGGMVRDVSRFLTGFLPMMKAGKAAGLGTVGASAAAGAVTEGLTKDPTEANLTDLVKKFPALQTPVTDLLTSDPNDGEAVARAKKAFEGAGLGALAEGVALAVRSIAVARRAKMSVPDAAKAVDEARAQFGEVSDRDFLALGAPGGKGVVVRAPPAEGPSAGSVAATKLAQSEAKTSPGLTPLTFTTEKGSVYEVQGTGTVRNKAQRAEHGADQGLKPRSDRTVYIDMASANRLATPNSGWRMFAHDDGTFSVIVKNADGKWGISPSARNVKVSTTPEKGLVPLEVWTPDEAVQGFGGVAYKKVHFGNKIVSIGEQAGTGVPDDVAAKGLTLAGDTGGKAVVKRDAAKTAAEKIATSERAIAGTTPKVGGDDLPLKWSARAQKPEQAIGNAYEILPLNKENFEKWGVMPGKTFDQYKALIKAQGDEVPTHMKIMTRDGNRKFDGVGSLEKLVKYMQARERKGWFLRGEPDGAEGLAWRKIGDEEAEEIARSASIGVPDDVAAKGLTKVGDVGGKEVYVNFGRIDEPDSVKKIIGHLADAFAGDIKEAARGVQSNAETKRLAERLGMTVEDLLNRQKGQPFNAEQAHAARQLLNASAEKLLSLAERAASPNAGPVDQFMFRRMMAVHHAIQAEVIGARTETARALQAWSIPVNGGGIERSRAVKEMLDQMGGAETSQAMAKRLSILAKEGDQQAVDRFVGKTWGTASMDVIREAWINGLLSSPKTHIVNMTSNTALQANAVIERAIAGAISRSKGSGQIVDGEAMAMAYGLVNSTRDAFRLAAKSFREGNPVDLAGKVDLAREPAIKGDWLRQSGHNGMAAAVDFIGTAARVPTRALGAEDAFFKTWGYRAEVHAQALRLAQSEGKTGPARWTRMMEIANDPPEYIRLAAADAAAYNTFTNATGVIGQRLGQLRDIPGVFFVLPFVSTPVNIARHAFERSPVAPLVGQWRADLAAGGARADLALARMGTGSAIMMMGVDAASNGLITGAGPDDAGEKANLQRQGWQPYSVYIGGKYYSYNRMDPLGTTLGFAANMAELIARYDIEPEEVDEISEQFAAGVALVSSVLIDKTYMQGVSEAINAMAESDTRADKTVNFVNRLAASVVPAGANALATGMDTGSPEINSMADAIMARIPLLREKLTRKRDLWGQVIQMDPGYGMFSPVVSAVSPIAVSQEKDSPIDAEMQRLNMNVQRIGKRVDFDGVAVNLRDYPKVYEQYVMLAGNELKHKAWNLGAKDLLDAIVSGQHQLSEVYRMQPDTSKPDEGGKAQFIMKIITEYRQMARRKIMEDGEHPEFSENITGQKERAREGRMPQIQ